MRARKPAENLKNNDRSILFVPTNIDAPNATPAKMPVTMGMGMDSGL